MKTKLERWIKLLAISGQNTKEQVRQEMIEYLEALKSEVEA